MIEIFFDQASIDFNARYLIKKAGGELVGVREEGEAIGGQRSVKVDPNGAKVALDIFFRDGMHRMFCNIKDGSKIYAFTGDNDKPEMARMREIELAAIAAATGDEFHMSMLRAALGINDKKGD